MPSLNANAIITLNDYGRYHGVGLGTGTDDLIASGSYAGAINQASTLIESFYGYALLSGSLCTEYFEGDNAHEYYTRRAPLINIQSIEYFEGTLNAEWRNIGLDLMYKDFDTVDGRVFFIDGNRFFRSSAIEKNWKIKYAYGYTSTSTIPQDIKSACCMIVQFILKRGEVGQIGSFTTGSHSRTYELKMPEDALNILRRYVRYSN